MADMNKAGTPKQAPIVPGLLRNNMWESEERF